MAIFDFSPVGGHIVSSGIDTLEKDRVLRPVCLYWPFTLAKQVEFTFGLVLYPPFYAPFVFDILFYTRDNWVRA